MAFQKGITPEGAKPFVAGQSGNPEGRKPGTRNVSTILREMLERMAPGDVIDSKFVKEFCKGKKRVTSADATAARILFEALVKGEQWAVKELLDRTEGKAKQALELTGKDGEELVKQITVVVKR